MRPVHLHIGLNKCASTLLQKHVMPSLQGVRVTGTREIERSSRDRAVVAALRELTRESHWQQGALQKAIAGIPGADSLAISEEGLSSSLRSRSVETRLRSLQRVAKELDVRSVVLVLREQEAILLSNYREYVATGGIVTLSRFIAGRAAGGPCDFSQLLDYAQLYRDVAASFPDADITVLLFEEFLRDRETFLRTFARAMGSTNAGEIAEKDYPRERASLGPVGCGIQGAVNRRYGLSDERWWSDLPRGFSRIRSGVRKLDEIVARALPSYAADLAAREARTLSGFSEQFRASNRQLATRLGIDLARYGYVS